MKTLFALVLSLSATVAMAATPAEVFNSNHMIGKFGATCHGDVRDFHTEGDNVVVDLPVAGTVNHYVFMSATQLDPKLVHAIGTVTYSASGRTVTVVIVYKLDGDGRFRAAETIVDGEQYVRDGLKCDGNPTPWLQPCFSAN